MSRKWGSWPPTARSAVTKGGRLAPAPFPFAWLLVSLLIAAGCSGDDDVSGADRPSVTTSTSQRATTLDSTSVASTTPSGSSTTAGPVSTSATPTTRAGSTSSLPQTTATTTATQPLVAEAGGWRLVVSQPVPGGTIGTDALFCYAATGTVREPDLVLEVTVNPQGVKVRAPIAVGSGAVRLNVGAAGAGAHDLRVQLIVNGEAINGLAVTIPSVTTVSGATAPACP